MEYIKAYPNKIDKKVKTILNMTGYREDKIKKYLSVYSKLLKYTNDENNVLVLYFLLEKRDKKFELPSKLEFSRCLGVFSLVTISDIFRTKIN